MNGLATHQSNGSAYKLTEAEKIWLGLKRKPRPVGTIQISIPEHIGSRSIMWQDRFVTEAALEDYIKRYPNLQIIGRIETQEPEALTWEDLKKLSRLRKKEREERR